MRVRINFLDVKRELEIKTKEEATLDSVLKTVSEIVGGRFGEILTNALNKNNINALPWIIINEKMVLIPYNQVKVKDSDSIIIWQPRGGG
jgi:hypothetical protein